MKIEEKLIYFETAELLKELGYSSGGFNSYTKYLSDYIYDKDPAHPESHKAGDIRIGRFYVKNNDMTDGSNEYYYSCEAPLLSQIQKWLMDVHGAAVLVDLDMTLSWIWKIIPMDTAASIQVYYESPQVWCGHNEIDICLEDGILKCLSLIKELKK